ncbi:hypothetical protein [Amorphus sp. MBR-141]
MEVTFRVVDFADRHNVGRTAASEDLALSAAGNVQRNPNSRFAVERSEWDEANLKVRRSEIVEAESLSKPWEIGV